jgi:DNA invertase Pin-like site-specific DNA recombinase
MSIEFVIPNHRLTPAGKVDHSKPHADLVTAYAEFMAVPDIARLFGVHVTTIFRVLKRAKAEAAPNAP